MDTGGWLIFAPPGKTRQKDRLLDASGEAATRFGAELDTALLQVILSSHNPAMACLHASNAWPAIIPFQSPASA